MKKVLSLGCGIESTALYLLAHNAKEDKESPLFGLDAAIFANTRFEEKSTILTLKKLIALQSIPIYITGDESIKKDETLNVPLFTMGQDGKSAPLNRQCTGDFKIEPVKRELRKRFPSEKIELWVGHGTNEVGRATPSLVKYITKRFPLIELGLSRLDCANYLKETGWENVKKSACLCCPFRSNSEWHRLKKESPLEFEQSVKWERQQNELHPEKEGVYLHRSLAPLDQIVFKDENQTEINFGCHGECHL